MPTINPLLAAVETPPIPAAHAWAACYDGRLGPLLDLCQAVPGYAPHPEMLARAAAAAGDAANAKYGLINGDLALREIYAAEVSAVYGGVIEPDQVAITAGCNQAFFLTMLTLAQAGDNVLLPTPWFWNHQQTCGMLGIEPRTLTCRAEAGFVPDPSEAARLIDGRTRAVVLVTPNNPTGAVYPAEVIGEFRDLCAAKGVMLIVDETYRDFLPASQGRAHSLFAHAGWADHVIQLYSFSKAFCVPGHRLGAVVADRGLVQAFMKALDCLHICPQRGGQVALEWAIPALRSWRVTNREVINGRAAAMRDAFAELPEWRLDSLGAYFAYVRHPHPDRTAAAVAADLASRVGAVGLPGSAFGPGQERYLRLAFANMTVEAIADLSNRIAATGAAGAT